MQSIPPSISNPDLKSQVLTTLLSAGWDFTATEYTSSVMPATIRITRHGEHTPKIQSSHITGPAPSWEINYPALSFLLNGQYYSDYHATFGLMGLPVMSGKTWDKLVSWLGKHVEALAKKPCEQVQQRIIDRGDKLNWTASFDSFYLTRGHHSNNCSATLHDHSSDKIAGLHTEPREVKVQTGKEHQVGLKVICSEQF